MFICSCSNYCVSHRFSSILQKIESKAECEILHRLLLFEHFLLQRQKVQTLVWSAFRLILIFIHQESFHRNTAYVRYWYRKVKNKKLDQCAHSAGQARTTDDCILKKASTQHALLVQQTISVYNYWNKALRWGF